MHGLMRRGLETEWHATAAVPDPTKAPKAHFAGLEKIDPDVVTATTRSADLLREGRELLLDLVDRAEVRDATAAWTGRVNTVTDRTDRVDVDALPIRPDGCVAWALPTGQDLDATPLVRALGTWFDQPA